MGSITLIKSKSFDWEWERRTNEWTISIFFSYLHCLRNLNDWSHQSKATLFHVCPVPYLSQLNWIIVVSSHYSLIFVGTSKKMHRWTFHTDESIERNLKSSSSFSLSALNDSNNNNDQLYRELISVCVDICWMYVWRLDRILLRKINTSDMTDLLFS